MNKIKVAAASAAAFFAANAEAATIITVDFNNFDKTGIYTGNGRNFYGYTENGVTVTPGNGNQWNVYTKPDASLLGTDGLLSGQRNGQIPAELTFTLPRANAFMLEVLNFQNFPKTHSASYSFTGYLGNAEVCSVGGSVGASYANTAGSLIGLTCNSAFDKTTFKLSEATNQFSITKAVVTAVPEPATWGMMIAGIGMIGGAMRHRRQQTAKATFG